MASKQKYECYRCRDNGFPDTMVFLGGKDEQGKTVCIEDDGTGHVHKQKQQKQQQQGGKTIVSESTQLKVVSARLEYAISLLEKLTGHRKRVGTDG